MKRQADVIVIGLGTAGAATCMVLARRGIRVLGLDAHHPPHRRGSHYDQSRNVGRAYMEGSATLPMAQHAWKGWRKLERDSGQKLLVKTGNLTLGLPSLLPLRVATDLNSLRPWVKSWRIVFPDSESGT